MLYVFLLIAEGKQELIHPDDVAAKNFRAVEDSKLREQMPDAADKCAVVMDELEHMLLQQEV